MRIWGMFCLEHDEYREEQCRTEDEMRGNRLKKGRVSRVLVAESIQ